MTLVREIIDGLRDLWRDDWEGKVIAAAVGLLAVGCLALVLFVGVAIYREIDSRHLNEGVITSKSYRPMWIQENCVQVGKSLTCTPIIHPESWTVTVEGVDDRGQQNKRVVTIPEGRWNGLRVGDFYKVE